MVTLVWITWVDETKYYVKLNCMDRFTDSELTFLNFWHSPINDSQVLSELISIHHLPVKNDSVTHVFAIHCDACLSICYVDMLIPCNVYNTNASCLL